MQSATLAAFFAAALLAAAFSDSDEALFNVSELLPDYDDGEWYTEDAAELLPSLQQFIGASDRILHVGKSKI
jgi:hypothetical protein